MLRCLSECPQWLKLFPPWQGGRTAEGARRESTSALLNVGWKFGGVALRCLGSLWVIWGYPLFPWNLEAAYMANLERVVQNIGWRNSQETNWNQWELTWDTVNACNLQFSPTGSPTFWPNYPISILISIGKADESQGLTGWTHMAVWRRLLALFEGDPWITYVYIYI